MANGTIGSNPEIVLLCCRQCAPEDVESGALSRSARDVSVRLSLVPCGSAVEVSHILKLLEHGADGVEIVACPESACRSLVGSVRARKRVEYAGKLLDEIGVGASRVGITRKTGLSETDLADIASVRAEAVRGLGAHPMKKGRGKK